MECAVWSESSLVFTWTPTQKTYPRTFAPSEDSDQPAHSRSLIRILTRCILDSQGWELSSCGQLEILNRLRSCADWFESSTGAHIRRYVFSRGGLYIWVYNRLYYFLLFSLHWIIHYLITLYLYTTRKTHAPTQQYDFFFLSFLLLFWKKVFYIEFKSSFVKEIIK